MRSILYAAIAVELLALNAYVVPLVGAEHIARNDPPPRMIFVESEDTPSAPEGPGGNPRPLFTVLEASELVIFGQTRDHVEGMRDQFLIALHKACKKSGQDGPRAGRYVVSKGGYKRAALVARNGYEYRLTFAVAYPVVDRKWAALDPLPQEPIASTYTGDQANTYAVVPGDEVELTTTVGVTDVDAVEIVINPAPPPEDP